MSRMTSSEINARLQSAIDKVTSPIRKTNTLSEAVHDWFTAFNIKEDLENEFLNTHSQLFRGIKNSHDMESLITYTQAIIYQTAMDRKIDRREILQSFILQLKGVEDPSKGLYWPDEYYYDVKYIDKVNYLLPCINPYSVRESDGFYKLYMTGGNGACSSLRKIFKEFGECPTQNEIYLLTGARNVILKRTKNTSGYRYNVMSDSRTSLVEFADYLLELAPSKGTKITKKQYDYLLSALEYSDSLKLDYISDLLTKYLKLVTVKD